MWLWDRPAWWLAAAVFFALMVAARPVAALPSFARQTGQPCATCHVGAFGPQLTPFGREFKLNGYVQGDGEGHLPLAAMAQASFTHIAKDQPGGAAGGFGPNDNGALDQLSVFYGGRITDHAGAFVQVTYDGVANRLTWDNADLRYVRSLELFGGPLLLGATLNNNPTVQDAWNSTPAWGFPFAGSNLAPTPAAGTLIDGALAGKVAGAGGYAWWNNLLYLEADLYHGLSAKARYALGAVPVGGDDRTDGAFPYWRVALQHDFGRHTVEIGSFGIDAAQFPGGDRSSGHADRLTDLALDASYLYDAAPDWRATAYATLIHERQRLAASSALAGSNPRDRLTTLRLNGSVSLRDTVTLSGQRFQTSGSNDPARFGGAGSPNSAGWIGEVAYVPGGKADGGFPDWVNARLSLQYTAYTEFDGTSRNASDNDPLFVLLWLAW